MTQKMEEAQKKQDEEIKKITFNEPFSPNPAQKVNNQKHDLNDINISFSPTGKERKGTFLIKPTKFNNFTGEKLNLSKINNEVQIEK